MAGAGRLRAAVTDQFEAGGMAGTGWRFGAPANGKAKAGRLARTCERAAATVDDQARTWQLAGTRERSCAAVVEAEARRLARAQRSRAAVDIEAKAGRLAGTRKGTARTERPRRTKAWRRTERRRRSVGVIVHVVLFKPQRALDDRARHAVLDAVAAAVRQCPTVKACRIGRRTRHGLPGYEQAMTEDFEYALFLEFEDVDGLRAYLTNPAHGRAGEFFTSAAASSLAYDYELADISDARRLLEPGQ